jgi:VanZ family protein
MNPLLHNPVDLAILIILVWIERVDKFTPTYEPGQVASFSDVIFSTCFN